jgi:transcriptional regulator with XRE-family HTH domain
MRSTPPLPLPVKRALAKLGQDIRSARLRRIATTTMAERAFITRPTLAKVERGDPSVSLGIQATILFLLGMTPRAARPYPPDIGMTIALSSFTSNLMARRASLAGSGRAAEQGRPIQTPKQHRRTGIRQSLGDNCGRGGFCDHIPSPPQVATIQRRILMSIESFGGSTGPR